MFTLASAVADPVKKIRCRSMKARILGSIR
jgi:hypothetical protein